MSDISTLRCWSLPKVVLSLVEDDVTWVRLYIGWNKLWSRRTNWSERNECDHVFNSEFSHGGVTRTRGPIGPQRPSLKKNWKIFRASENFWMPVKELRPPITLYRFRNFRYFQNGGRTLSGHQIQRFEAKDLKLEIWAQYIYIIDCT